MTPDDVLAELRQIRIEQEKLELDSPAYAGLERRRRELREMAQAAADSSRNEQALLQELEHLEARLQQMDDEKIDIPEWQQAMSKYAINDPAAPANIINRTIDDKNEDERRGIEARIVQIREALAE